MWIQQILHTLMVMVWTPPGLQMNSTWSPPGVHVDLMETPNIRISNRYCMFLGSGAVGIVNNLRQLIFPEILTPDIVCFLEVEL
jgi:hypothetical protein